MIAAFGMMLPCINKPTRMATLGCGALTMHVIGVHVNATGSVRGVKDELVGRPTGVEGLGATTYGFNWPLC